jgi:hypothetical protein
MIYRVEVWDREELNCYIESDTPITAEQVKKFFLHEEPSLRRNASLQIMIDEVKPVNARYFWGIVRRK